MKSVWWLAALKKPPRTSRGSVLSLAVNLLRYNKEEEKTA
jgi:hypothetical protein